MPQTTIVVRGMLMLLLTSLQQSQSVLLKNKPIGMAHQATSKNVTTIKPTFGINVTKCSNNLTAGTTAVSHSTGITSVGHSTGTTAGDHSTGTTAGDYSTGTTSEEYSSGTSAGDYSTGTTEGSKTQGLVFGITFGILLFLLLIIVIIAIVLLLKFYRRKQTTSKADPECSQQISTTQNIPPNDCSGLYATVQKPKANSSSKGEMEELNYSSIKFSEKEAKGKAEQSDTEYSEITFP